MDTPNAQFATGTAGASCSSQSMPIPEKGVSAASYFWPIAVLALLVEPYNRNQSVRFHAFQSLLLSGGCLALYMVIAMVFAIFGTLGMFILGSMNMYGLISVGATLGSAMYLILNLTLVVTWFALVISAATGKKIQLPLIGQKAQELATRQ